jgi:hypothetical protein
MNNSSLTKRIWYHYPYVAPADVLSAEPTHEDDPSNLRDDASRDSRCYLKFIRSFRDGTYLARVAASPLHLRNQGYTVVLNEVQFAKARPWNDQLLKSV